MYFDCCVLTCINLWSQIYPPIPCHPAPHMSSLHPSFICRVDALATPSSQMPTWDPIVLTMSSIHLSIFRPQLCWNLWVVMAISCLFNLRLIGWTPWALVCLPSWLRILLVLSCRCNWMITVYAGQRHRPGSQGMKISGGATNLFRIISDPLCFAKLSFSLWNFKRKGPW